MDQETRRIDGRNEILLPNIKDRKREGVESLEYVGVYVRVCVHLYERHGDIETSCLVFAGWLTTT